jgi:hypothetical protein
VVWPQGKTDGKTGKRKPPVYEGVNVVVSATYLPTAAATKTKHSVTVVHSTSSVTADSAVHKVGLVCAPLPFVRQVLCSMLAAALHTLNFAH